MWIQLYFIFGSLETLFLLAFTVMEKSLPEESVFLGYSGERLALIAGILAIFICFIILSWYSFFPKSSLNQRIQKILQDQRFLWITLAVCVGVVAAIYFFLTQPPEWFGARLALFTRMKALLFWLQTLSWQTIFFILIWYSVQFINKPEGGPGLVSIKEIDLLLLIFLASIVLKLAFVLPGTYGLFKDVGESKYFNMIYYLFEGKLYTSADDVTTHYPLFYPLMLLATYYVKNYTFTCIMLLNSIFASSIIFPLYLMARRMLNRKYSLILVVIASLIPFQFLLPNRLLSENLYFPLLLWSMYLAFVQPQDPRQRILWDGLTGVAFGLLYLTRFISLAVIPFLMLIWWLKPFADVNGIFQWSWKKISHAVLILLITAVVFSPWVFIGTHNGLSLKETLGFGIASNTNPQQLTLANLAKWMVLYLAYYVLLAAPVLNLIVMALKTFPLTKIKDENSRWILSLILLMTGFTAAVVRHSWRAYYNLELPTRIMGRYIIYLLPLFLLCGFIGMSNFNRSNFRSFFHFLAHTTLVQLVVVAASYLVIISGKLIPIGENFIEPLISIDGFYIQQLGIYFFVFILILYIGMAYFLWFGRHKAVEFAGCVLIAFYLFAEPDCVGLLKKQSTYQKLGYTISEFMLETNQTRGENLDYTIYISDGLQVGDRKDFAWSLYVRNLDCGWEIIKYDSEDQPQLGDQNGFVIYPMNEMQIPVKENVKIIEIDGEKFVVEQNLE